MNQAGKRARSLLNCISVTDDIEINEQNKPIATGLLYVQPEFDAFSTLVRGEMRISNPRGLTNVVSTARKMLQKSIFTQRNGVETSVGNLKGKGSTVAKMCCLVQP